MLVAAAVVVIVFTVTHAARAPLVRHVIELSRPSIALAGARETTSDFTVQDAWKNATVSGRFTASGGAGISVMVMTHDNYLHWRNLHRGATLYDSGTTTTGTIKTGTLAPGRYNLVFSSPPGPAPQTIAVRAELVYMGPR